MKKPVVDLPDSDKSVQEFVHRTPSETQQKYHSRNAD